MIFASEYANIVQFISLPLELLGLTLTLIQVYKQDVGIRIEERLNVFHKNLRIYSYSIGMVMREASESVFDAIFGWNENGKLKDSSFFLIFISIAILFFSIKIIAGAEINVFDDLISVFFLSIFSVVFIPMFIGVIVGIVEIALISITKILIWIFSFLNNLTNGQSLSSIGIIVAFLGVSGEIYQVLTILLQNDSSC